MLFFPETQLTSFGGAPRTPSRQSNRIVVYLDPGAAEPEDIAAYLEAISDLHVALGGDPLEIVKDDIGSIVCEAAPHG